MSNKLVIPNWSRLNYTSAVYQIAPTPDGRFHASVHLFLDEPMQGQDAPLNRVVIIPLNIVQSSPEKLIVYLYLLGPIFNHTSDKALETNEAGQVIKKWAIIPADQAPTVYQDHGGIRPTHMGSDSIN